MLKSSSLLLAIVISLTGCSSNKVTLDTYPERQKFAFIDPLTESKNFYLCKAGKTPKATKERAKAAHDYLSSSLEETIKKEIEQGMESKKKPSLFDTMKLAMRVRKQGKVINKTLEKKYQCMLVDSKSAS